MPSPFPGMDPYLESRDIWPDFHSRFINVMSERLMPLVRPRYSVRIEERVYLEFELEGRERLIRPDVTLGDRGWGSPSTPAGAAATAVPVQIEVLVPEEVREVSLVIRREELEQVVTVVELLSPANKRANSAGRVNYLAKRNAVLRSPAHLVEIDLLRAGERMPMRSALPPGDYHVVLSRREKRPECDVYSFGLRDPLPPIPIPLAAGDADVPLDFQAVFSAVYDRAGYDYTLRYDRESDPPLPPAEARWAKERVGRGE